MKTEAEFNGKKGVWRTVSGRRIFIAEGEDLKTAMKNSGKFEGGSRTERNKGLYDRLAKKIRGSKANKQENEYELYKRAKENPNSIDPMTENSTDWEALDEKYNKKYQKEEFEKNRDKKVKEIVARQRKQMADLKYNEKNRLRTEAENASNKWASFYNNNKNIWGDEKLKKKDEKLSQKRDESYKNYQEYMSKYYERGNEVRTWEDQIEKNNYERDKKLKDLDSQRDSMFYKYHPDKWSDDHYGTYKEYEGINAKVKVENDNDLYKPVSSYYSMSEKQHKLSGSRTLEDGSTEFGNKSWTGKEYTNDEFLEHLEDANWHTERRMLLDAKLTNAQMKYIKDNTTLSEWSVGDELTGRENVARMIKLAKTKFPKKRTRK